MWKNKDFTSASTCLLLVYIFKHFNSLLFKKKKNFHLFLNVLHTLTNYCFCDKVLKLPFADFSVVPGSVQVPENQTRGQQSFRTGPGTAKISESVLEPEPEPPKALDLFRPSKCPKLYTTVTSGEKGFTPKRA